jgi:pantothenate kinase-related protein Tda10
LNEYEKVAFGFPKATFLLLTSLKHKGFSFCFLSLHVTYIIEYICMDKIVELSVENFKAVKKADIALNGITVVSGINGCGKSSLSQLLYYSFYYANHFNEIVDSVLDDSLLEDKDSLQILLISAMNDVIKQSDENKKMMAMNLMGGFGSFGQK